MITSTSPCALREEGNTKWAAAEALIRVGEASEDCLPYLSATAAMCCVGSSCTLPSCPVKYRADSFKVVAVSDQTEEEIIKVKQALLEHGPMEVGYYAAREDYTDTSRNATVIANSFC